MAQLTPPNAANIAAVANASHSGENAFQIGQKLMHMGAERKRAKDIAAVKQQRQAQAAYNQDHSTAIKVNNAINKQRAQQQAGAKKAAAAHAAGVKKGTTAPMPGAAPRTFAMPAGPQGQAAQAHMKASAQAAKTMQQQRNAAHGQAIQMQNQMNRQAVQTQAQHARVMKQQVNTAHGQALQMQSQMDKSHAKAVAQNKVTQAQTPAKKVAPVGTTKGGIMTHLSETETNKTNRPNEFTVQSKKQPTTKTNTAGLGAMGAKLEEGLANRRLTLPQPRKRV